MFMRQLGRSGISVSALGLGCWAIGGPAWRGDQPIGWGLVDDAESVRAIHRALELGITLFDTADVYGTGHSETVLGQALRGRREGVVIATKFGKQFEAGTGRAFGEAADSDYIRAACEASLRRLGVDVIDLYQFHNGGHDLDDAARVRDVLEELVTAGKIRWYGWSTDVPAAARVFAEGPHCTAIQQRFSLFSGNTETLAVCEAANLASLNRGPLGKGLLTGKFTADSRLPQDDNRHSWDFRIGPQAEMLQLLDRLRSILTRDGRTLAQAALGWLWARSPQAIPIPGFKTVAQVEENAGALNFGPLSPEQVAELDMVLAEAPGIPRE